MKNIKYHMELGEMTTCTNRTLESTNELYQRGIKGATIDCFIFDSRFYFKKLEEAVMGVDAYMISMVKTNKKLFCKDIRVVPDPDGTFISILTC